MVQYGLVKSCISEETKITIKVNFSRYPLPLTRTTNGLYRFKTPFSTNTLIWTDREEKIEYGNLRRQGDTRETLSGHHHSWLTKRRTLGSAPPQLRTGDLLDEGTIEGMMEGTREGMTMEVTEWSNGWRHEGWHERRSSDGGHELRWKTKLVTANFVNWKRWLFS